MKKLLTVLLIILPIIANGQKIAKNEIDKFTKQHILETDQEALVKRNKWKNQWQRVLVSIRNVDGEWFMPAFIELEEIENYDSNSQVVLLLDNDEPLILQSLFSGIGAEDCPIGIGGVNPHVHGFSTILPLTEVDVNLLRNHAITDVRVSPLGANHDFEVGKKEMDIIQRMIKLIDDKLK